MEVTASQVTLTRPGAWQRGPALPLCFQPAHPPANEHHHGCPGHCRCSGVSAAAVAIGRAVTAAGERCPDGLRRRRQYLAGRLDGVHITALIHGEDELLVSFSTQATGATRYPLAKVFRVTASECPWPASSAGVMKAHLFAPTSATTAPSCSPTPCWAATPPASPPSRPLGAPAGEQSPRISHRRRTRSRLARCLAHRPHHGAVAAESTGLSPGLASRAAWAGAGTSW